MFAVSCSKSDYKVKVKYTNATGIKIEGLKIGNQRIGILGIGEETKTIPYQEFGFDSGLPDERVTGKIDGEKILDYSTFIIVEPRSIPFLKEILKLKSIKW